MLLTYFCITAFLLSIFLLLLKISRSSKLPKGLKEVPLVEGCLPLIGHSLKVNPKNLPVFMEECYKKYGNIFKLKFLNETWVAICDKEFFPTFFSVSEDALSFFTVLSRFYIFAAFNLDHIRVYNWMGPLRQSMSSPLFRGRCKEDKKLCELMASEAFEVVKNVEKENGNSSGINLGPILTKYFASVASSVIFGLEVPRETSDAVYNFTQTINKCIEMGTYLPLWVVRLMYQGTLDKYAKQIAATYKTLVQEYRGDGAPRDSPFLRHIIDFRNPKTNKGFTDEEIGNLITIVNFMTTENTTAAILRILTNLLSHPEILRELKDQVTPIVDKGDFDALLDAPLLHGCVMETARLSVKTGLFTRTPLTLKSINGYYIGDADFLSVATTLIQTYPPKCKDAFPQEDKFSPGEGSDYSGYNLLTWGAGTHMCTGRILAQKMMKIVTALLIAKLDFDEERLQVGGVKFFSNSVITEYETKVFLRQK